jgi:hypothetical protein
MLELGRVKSLGLAQGKASCGLTGFRRAVFQAIESASVLYKVPVYGTESIGDEVDVLRLRGFRVTFTSRAEVHRRSSVQTGASASKSASVM